MIELSEEERAVVNRFEAAPELPEVVRERVADAISVAHVEHPLDDEARRAYWLRHADAAIAAMGGAE